MISDWYARWIGSREHELASRDTNRKVLPFEWGIEWLELPPAEKDPAAALTNAVDGALRNSHDFFSYQRPAQFEERAGHLTFTSPVVSPYPENNTVHAQYLPSTSSAGRAVLVLPQWNATEEDHIGLCRLLNRYGISALRMSKAYHGLRMPAGLERADYHVSSNLGRTIHATRQSVIDARCCVDWLLERGYSRVGILGTSLGSCVAFLTAAHEPRLSAGAFTHVSPHFGDVVWTGIATQHVRESLAANVSREELRRYWSVISPASYMGQFEDRDFRSLVIWARYDPVFLPEYTREFIDSFPATDTRCLPCGHYTVGQFPFNWMDGLSICRFLSKQL